MKKFFLVCILLSAQQLCGMNHSVPTDLPTEMKNAIENVDVTKILLQAYPELKEGKHDGCLFRTQDIDVQKKLSPIMLLIAKQIIINYITELIKQKQFDPQNINTLRTFLQNNKTTIVNYFLGRNIGSIFSSSCIYEQGTETQQIEEDLELVLESYSKGKQLRSFVKVEKNKQLVLAKVEEIHVPLSLESALEEAKITDKEVSIELALEKAKIRIEIEEIPEKEAIPLDPDNFLKKYSL